VRNISSFGEHLRRRTGDELLLDSQILLLLVFGGELEED
jgi:hypothetical protein